jgi:branched-chain amino acid transport system ATP-binding protein
MYISASAPTLALEVDKLTAKYGRIPILNGVTFTARAGEVLGILGYNGMGKTTLMKVLIGLLPSSGGTIRFESKDITRETAFLRSRAGIGYVPQGREVFPRLSVRDNLRMGASALGAERDQVVRSVVAEFPILERLYDRMAGTLSGGEQQILAIARALCARPRLLLLDEPTEGIQPSIIDQIAEALARLATAGNMTIILVEQNLEFVAGLASRALIIQKGLIVSEVPPQNLHSAMEIDEIAGIQL